MASILKQARRAPEHFWRQAAAALPSLLRFVCETMRRIPAASLVSLARARARSLADSAESSSHIMKHACNDLIIFRIMTLAITRRFHASACSSIRTFSTTARHSLKLLDSSLPDMIATALDNLAILQARRTWANQATNTVSMGTPRPRTTRAVARRPTSLLRHACLPAWHNKRMAWASARERILATALSTNTLFRHCPRAAACQVFTIALLAPRLICSPLSKKIRLNNL
jgi:hypothetical protein